MNMRSLLKAQHAMVLSGRAVLMPLLFCIAALLMSCEEDTDLRADAKGYDEAMLLESREEKDDLFRTSSESPIPTDQRAAFRGLHFYEPSSDYYVDAEVDWHNPADTVIIGTSVGGDDRRAVRAATLKFTLNGQKSKLSGYELLDLTTPHEGQLFVPFRDATNGFTTYEAGRYLDLPIERGEKTVAIDFNTAYHPLCLFNHMYSCPIPPTENTLRYKVEAGEKK